MLSTSPSSKINFLFRLVASGLLFCILFSTVAPPVLAQSRASLRSKKYRVDARRSAIRAKKNANLRKMHSVTQQMIKNQQKLYSAEKELNTHKKQLTQTKTQLGVLSKDIDRSVGEVSRLNQTVAQRIRALHMGGRVSMLQMIFESGNLAAFLDGLYYRHKLVASDKRLLGELKERTDRLKQQQKRLAEQQSQIGQSINKVQQLRGSIGVRLKTNQRHREQYRKNANYYARTEDELLSESRRIRRELRRTIKKQAKSGFKRSSKGRFVWPVRGQITSPFGYRTHPIHRRRKMHTGLDIAKRRGSPIRAADGGRVIYSGWRGGYGRVIMINHGTRGGKSLVTLYGHCSSLLVHKGQTVKKGQAVARIGTSGYSTGPHLHFEVRLNGRVVNPKRYLP